MAEFFPLIWELKYANVWSSTSNPTHLDIDQVFTNACLGIRLKLLNPSDSGWKKAGLIQQLAVPTLPSGDITFAESHYVYFGDSVVTFRAVPYRLRLRPVYYANEIEIKLYGEA